MQKCLIKDEEFGEVEIHFNSRAKYLRAKVKDGELTLVVPPGMSLNTINSTINTLRPRIAQMLQRSQPLIKFDETTVMQTNTFTMRIFRSNRANFYMRLADGVLSIACPEQTDFSLPSVQHVIKSFLERALRHEAKRTLPSRLDKLARQHGFSYNNLRIINTKTRWGSCSIKGNINLAVAVMLLPDRLLDYIILHELCHTKEMNHGERFWKLMDDVTDGQAKLMRKELSRYSLSTF